MAIIPTVRVSRAGASIALCTRVLELQHPDGNTLRSTQRLP
jgi:hypothetical protein